MDEIEWSKRLRNFILVVSIITIPIAILIGIFIFNILKGTHYIDMIKDIVTNTSIIVISTSAIVLGIVYIIRKIKNNVNINGKEYIREICKEYPPALVSLIEEMKISVYKDYTATILYLYTKGYINIENFNNSIKIEKGENDNLSVLQEHEMYVYNCLLYNEKFDDVQFINYIVEDAKKANLIVRKFNNKEISGIVWRTLIVILFVFAFLYGLTSFSGKFINTIFFSLLVAIIVILLFLGIYRGVRAIIESGEVFGIMAKYKKSGKAKEETKRIKAIKNFIKDYTLIGEKSIEYVEILDEYIPYAVSLGETKEIEKYIIENEIYRDIIYNNKLS